MSKQVEILKNTYKIEEPYKKRDVIVHHGRQIFVEPLLMPQKTNQNLQ